MFRDIMFVCELLNRCDLLCFISDPRTDKILFISRRACEMFGISEDASDEEMRELVSHDDVLRADAETKARIESARGGEISQNLYSPTTGRFIMRRASLLSMPGEEYILHIFDDKTGDPSKADADLDKEREYRQHFLVDVSHAMRSQLNSVVGLASIAREAGDGSRVHKLMDNIEHVSSNMVALLDDMLYVAGLEGLDELDDYESNDTMPTEEEMQLSLREARRKSAEIIRGLPRCSLLIAEDVEIHREIVTAYLAETGADADFATNGAEAVEMFEAAPDKYDLILMDVHMPVMGGYEASRKIRSMPHERAKLIPILAMTANALTGDEDESFNAGMNGHITKPIDWTDFLSIIAYHLRKRPCRHRLAAAAASS